MNRICFFVCAFAAAGLAPVLGQNQAPVVVSPIAGFTVFGGAPGRSIDLAAAFKDADASTAVELSTVLGNVDVILYGQQKPITVANFLNYVNAGRYFRFDPTTQQLASSFIHRSIPGFVIQGGGFLGTADPGRPNNLLATQVMTFPAIQNEPGISNKRGTIAMAKVANNPNSATSQWFINLADNSHTIDPNTHQDVGLDVQNGGFTVFGRVAGSGMSVVDNIALVPRYNFGSPLDSIPLRSYDTSKPIKLANLVSIPAITVISPLVYSAQSDKPAVASVIIGTSGTKLLVTPGTQTGTAHIIVTARDLDGASVAQSFTVNVVAAPGRLVQLSTRLQIGTGNNVLIGGFIMRGDAPKRLMLRAIGPSTNLPGALADPVLELHDSATAIVASNDNWGDAPNKQDIINTGIAPSSPNESAILVTLPSNANNAAYTAIVQGANNSSGIGLVEVYDLDSGPGSTLLNISTRGRVDVDPNALIGGFIIGGTQSKNILVRAIGPSLPPSLSNRLADPILELRDGNGALVDSNDDWQTNNPNSAQIQQSGAAPLNPKESALLDTLPAGPYTAIVRGMNGTAGIGSVEVYQLP